MTGYVGEVGLVPPTNNAPLLNQRVGKFVFGKEGTEELAFVYCSTRRSEFKAEVEQKSHGSAQANVSAASILSIPVVVPTTSVLNVFNSMCRPIMDKLLSNYQQSQTLAQLRDALLPRLVSGALRVPDAMCEVEAIL